MCKASSLPLWFCTHRNIIYHRHKSVSLFAHFNSYSRYFCFYIYLSCLELFFFFFFPDTMGLTTQCDPTKDLHCIKSATSLLLETKTTLFSYLYCNINHLKCTFNCVYIMRHTKHTRKYIVNKLLLHY